VRKRFALELEHDVTEPLGPERRQVRVQRPCFRLAQRVAEAPGELPRKNLLVALLAVALLPLLVELLAGRHQGYLFVAQRLTFQFGRLQRVEIARRTTLAGVVRY
jgi:hypothetical protein